jgi:hypothetical protein
MVRIFSLLFNPGQPLSEVKKSDLEYDRSIFDIVRKAGIGTALLSAGGLFYSRRFSTNLLTAAWTAAVIISLLFIRRIKAIIDNIDQARKDPASPTPRTSQPFETPTSASRDSDSPNKLGANVSRALQTFNGSKPSEPMTSSGTPIDISNRSIPFESAKEKVGSTLSNTHNHNASEEALNAQVQKKKLANFVMLYDADSSSKGAVFALRNLMNSDHDFGLQEFAKRRQKKESTPSAEFLLNCLDGYRASEEDSSTYGFNKDAIYGILFLLKETKQWPTTPVAFHALGMILSDSRYRETFSDKTIALINWLLEDGQYGLPHFKKLVIIEIQCEWVRQQNSLEAASRTFIPIFNHFNARPSLVTELLNDKSALAVRQYLLAWVIATERPVSQGIGTIFRPFIQDAHEELWPEKHPPTHFLNRCLIQEGFKTPITKSKEHFKVNAAFHILLKFIESTDQTRLCIGHLRILRTMLYVLEGAEHINPNPGSRILVLFTNLLNQAQKDEVITQVFSYLLATFWCYRDKNHELETKKNLYAPIRSSFIAFFKQSCILQKWHQNLNKTHDLHMYLKPLI